MTISTSACSMLRYYPGPCPYIRNADNPIYFYSADDPYLVQHCLPGLEFNDDMGICTCVVVGESKQLRSCL